MVNQTDLELVLFFIHMRLLALHDSSSSVLLPYASIFSIFHPCFISDSPTYSLDLFICNQKYIKHVLSPLVILRVLYYHLDLKI